jgi:hypothetical protein
VRKKEKDFPKEVTKKKSRLPVSKKKLKQAEEIIIETQDLKKVITGLDYRSEGYHINTIREGA